MGPVEPCIYWDEYYAIYNYLTTELYNWNQCKIKLKENSENKIKYLVCIVTEKKLYNIF